MSPETTAQSTSTEALIKTKQQNQIPLPFSHPFRLLHWLVAVSFLALLLTGLSLHAVARPSWSLFGGILPDGLWQGRVNMVHMFSAVVFASSTICVLWTYVRRIGPRQRLHYIILVSCVAVVLTALPLIFLFGSPPIYWTARVLHAVIGVVILPLVLLWHIALGLTRYIGVLWLAFHPWAQPTWGRTLLFIPVVVVVAFVLLNGVPMLSSSYELTAHRIDATDLVDMAALPWDDARPMTIKLANGVGFDAGRTAVTLRAMHDGNELFILAEWDDSGEDRQYQPWEKTADGWKHLVSELDDESVYYEDKFSLTFPIETDWLHDRIGCAAYCHVGQGEAKHFYGYKGSPREVDVWHWKSTRTDPVGQIDDKYWSEVDFAAKDGGRHGDPKDGGGYSKNVSEDKTQPVSLPAGPGAIHQGVLLAEHAVDCTPEVAEQVAVGTIVPGIVSAAAQGDRGDISCQSRYVGDHWQLYIRRKLDTGSPHDRKFVPGDSHAFNCAAFDHSSKRHAYGLQTYRLFLE